MNSNKKNSTTISSRLDTQTYHALVNDAENKGISINSLINSIIKRHLLWDRFAEEMGLIPLTKRTLKKIFRTMDEEEIKKIAKDVGGTIPQELIYLSYDTFDFPNLMKTIEISDSRFGKVNTHVKDDIHSINILHGVCENFSLFLSETHQVLADSLDLKCNIEHSDNNMICMKFEKPNDPIKNEKF